MARIEQTVAFHWNDDGGSQATDADGAPGSRICLATASSAPAQDVARRILESAWWARFTFNGITRYERGTYDLVGGEELSDAERDKLLQLCRQHLDAYREQRGEEVGCLLTQKPAPSTTGAATAPRSAAR